MKIQDPSADPTSPCAPQHILEPSPAWMEHISVWERHGTNAEYQQGL